MHRTPEGNTLDLDKPIPELLDEILRDSFRPNFRVQCRLSRPNICRCRVDKAFTLPELPEEIQPEEDRNSNIGCEEARKLIFFPILLREDREAVEENDSLVDVSKRTETV